MGYNEDLNVVSTIETRLPTGVKDFLPIKASKLEYLQSSLRRIFNRWGFRLVAPSPLEDLAVLELGLGEDLREKTFRFDDRQSGRLVAFPPDITPQVARIAATRMQEMPLPFRLCYSGRVLRHTEQRLGKDREIYQSGVELIGLENPEADAEMIAMAIEGLQAVGAQDFTIDIGQVEFLRGILSNLEVPVLQAQAVRTAIASKDLSNLQKLVKTLPVEDRQREELLALPRLFGGKDTLERAAKVVTNDISRRALDNLHQVLEILDSYGVEEHLTIDLGEIRGFDYHTGLIFQGFLSGFGQAVCSGGRYDGLTARYGFPAPATGFSFSLLNLLFALDKNLESQVDYGSDILLFSAGSDKAPAHRLATVLRKQGYSVARDIITRDRQASLTYARRMHFRNLLVVEQDADNLTLLNTVDGRETTLNMSAVLAGELHL
ncbi:MAG: ATP phosphoribosyltransferase regulatory subunit [Desulfuromonadales bacterium]|nr:ATP phosphoribosyltransferase regulatory subunit [Desulfuromonadales bacterium]